MSQPFKALAPASIRTIEVDYYPPLVNPLAVDAGQNQTIEGSLDVTLSGSVFSVNGSTPTVEWTLLSGPGSASIDTPDALSTSVTVSDIGVYAFRLTASLAGWSVYDDVIVTFLPFGVNANLLVVGGGGGGGSVTGNGGDGGDFNYSVGVSLDPNQSYVVTLGSGGNGGTSFSPNPGAPGGQSSFGVLLISSGGAGGTGGGVSVTGDGGDGSGGAGFAGTGAGGGNGGAGTLNAISGASLCYGGGGGGGGTNVTLPGGDGGGCIGSLSGRGGNGNPAGSPLGSARGGGGGGGIEIMGPGGEGTAGADGVVVVRYAGAAQWTGGTITTSGGNTIHTFTSNGNLTPI